ncbi:hypothetical protein NA56DRAFT_649479 [Hyaloscypha hepaticicola]|uniref:Cora-domain-containing protein n=1 Tax=Hyaloscypha hepaticicola TaxID=2082293 RepID=A0A2J6PQL3_9HELO|nr:hypothetical protein NA56DRAFT_649479 [Hyaloscypha hepaticicola]
MAAATSVDLPQAGELPQDADLTDMASKSNRQAVPSNPLPDDSKPRAHPPNPPPLVSGPIESDRHPSYPDHNSSLPRASHHRASTAVNAPEMSLQEYQRQHGAGQNLEEEEKVSRDTIAQELEGNLPPTSTSPFPPLPTMDSSVEERYWKLIKSSQKLSYPGFVDSLERQTLWRRNAGRVAVFCQDKDSPQEFSTSDDLRRFLNDHPNKPDEARIFVLEDLPRSFVEILGSRLRIPPSFFADHWEDPQGGITTRGSVDQQDPNRRYMLRWQRLHQKNIVAEKKDGPGLYLLPSEVSRFVFRTSLFGKNVTISSEKLSYWCSKCSSFTLILVDPALGSVVYNPIPSGRSPQARRVIEDRDLDSWMKEYSQWTMDLQDLPANEEVWEALQRPPEMSSMYDYIFSLYQTQHYEMQRIPKLCRRMVLWSWRAQVNLTAKLVKRVVVFDLQQDEFLGQSEDKKVARWWLQAKLQMQALEEGIQLNMSALGIGGAKSIAVEWEAEDWKSLESTIEMAGRWIDVVYQFQTQSAGIDGTRGVVRLTSIAIIFAPVSVIAGVFAMGGDYAAGAKKFWVFWAVSIPLMSILSLILFRTIPLSWLRNLGNFKKDSAGDEESVYGRSEAKRSRRIRA